MSAATQQAAAASRTLAPLLAALAAIGPFSIDTYLPAFPAIAQSLQATTLQVQQTLTAYMAPFAFMILWHGSLSDAFGRRRVVLASLLWFVAGSVLCMLAPDIETLWLGRAVQGLSAGAGMVVGRAVIRDVMEGPDAQRLMARVAMIFGIAPAIAPIIGGWVHSWFGWRATFAFLVLFGLVLWIACRRWLPETLPPAQRHSMHPVKLGRAYLRAFTHAEFLLLIFAVSLNFNGFFIYVLSAPVFLLQHLGLTEREFAWMFVPTVVGLMTGSFLSGRLAGRLSPARTIAVGFAIMLTAALANLLVNAWLAPGLPHSVLPVAAYNIGMGLSMPSLTLLALDIFPKQRGLASSCQSFAHSGTSSFTAAVAAPLAWGTTQHLAFGMGAFLLAGLAAFALYLVLRPVAGSGSPG